MNKYWENETPIEVASTRNRLRWFPKAGRLQVSRPDWEDDDGKSRPGKTVTLDVDALRESKDAAQARAIFEQIVSALE